MSAKNKDLNVLDLFTEKNFVKICAPMVRYSKLQFRNLVRLYDCDLNFTPMIIADSFCQSEKARKNELTTNLLDSPLIAQFAANSVYDFVGAAYLSSPYCNGVDLNCGCPQRWAKEMELGCAMLKKPELVYDIIRQCRNRISKPFTVSVKMRLLDDVNETINFCKQLESCGVSFVSVHARTSSQISGDINKNILKLIKENCSIPIVANGGLTSLQDCTSLQTETNCDGFMIANGLLTNPTLFTGSTVTTINCIQNWLNICYNSTLTLDRYKNELKSPTFLIQEKPYNLTFQCFHHHLVFMLEKMLSRKEKQIFNNLRTFKDVLDYIDYRFEIKPQLFKPLQFFESVVMDLDLLEDEVYRNLQSLEELRKVEKEITYNYAECDGKYFKSKVCSTENNGSNLLDIFLEND